MNANGTTGDGVQIQLTENTPTWLKNILGNNGLTNAYTDRAGNLQFEGPSSTGQGLAYFSLLTVGGLHGVYEHSADGSTHLIGGNYGFDQGAAQLLVNAGQQKQAHIQLQAKADQAAQAAQIKLAAPQPLPAIQTQTNAPTKNIAVPPISIQAPKTASVIQAANGNPQGNNAAGAGINQAPGSGVKITGTTNAPVGMRF
jgi:hypothetical protein